MIRYVVITILVLAMAVLLRNYIPFLPHEFKSCAQSGDGPAHCTLVVDDGFAVVYELRGNGGIGAYGEGGPHRLPKDEGFEPFDGFGPGKYHLDFDNGVWAVVPIEMADPLVK